MKPANLVRRKIAAIGVMGCLGFPAVTILPAADEINSPTPVLEEESTDYNNWVDVLIGGTMVSHNDAQFQQRHGVPADEIYGGIQDLHLEKYVNKTTLLGIDGRIIYDNHDYLIKVGLVDPNKGFLQFGYSEFRTYYDGSGGFFPVNGQWFDLYDDQMAIDRGETWFKAGLTLPDKPQITFRYSHQFRDGQKDSTSWGDTTLTGVPPPNNTRKIVPSFYDIDETRDTFELDATHTIGNTEVGLGVRYEHLNQDNTRNERRNPGQANDRTITQEDEVKADLFNAHAYSETRLNEKVLFTLGGSYTRLETDIGGSRVYAPATAPPLGSTDEGFVDLAGGSTIDQYVGNLSLMYTPCDHFTIVPSLRIEHQDQTGDSEYGETAGIAAPVPIANERTRDFLDVSESLEARYTGIKNWVFTAGVQLLEGQGNLQETETELEDPIGLVTIARDTDSTRFTQKYKAGVNWYACTRANIAVQYYHKIVANDYDHNVDSTPNNSANRYPAYLVSQDFTTDDVNVRLTLRPFTGVTLVSRYDFQLSTVDTRADLLNEVQSADITSHIFSQSIGWTPWSRLFFQVYGTYACNLFETPADELIGAAGNLVTHSKNGYWSASFMATFVVNDKTDLDVGYSYYRADDYMNNAAFSQPFGADDEEHGVTVGITRRIRKNMKLSVKYGYFSYTDGASGGHNDYQAHMISSNFQYRF